MTIQKLFLTLLGTGLSPKSPAIVATFTALLIGIGILSTLGMETLFMIAFAVTVIAVFEINKYKNTDSERQEKEIVIQEAVGMWLALMITASTAATLDFPYRDILAIVGSFVTFRLFAVWQPSTIGWLRREVKGGLGMMMSSVLSGIAGGLLSAVVLMAMAKIL